jgi:Uma2 family endonuclease
MELETGVGEHGRSMERKPATYADLEALPENRVGEIVGGVLYASPRPASAHAVVSSRLGGILGTAFDWGTEGPGGWAILDEPELHLGSDVLVPDLAGWRRERMPRTPRVTAFTLAPDWVCEVLSPSTAALDRQDKLAVYAREGVRHVWLVDPDAFTVEVMRLEGAGYTVLAVHSGPARIHAEPFEAFAVNLALLWLET